MTATQTELFTPKSSVQTRFNKFDKDNPKVYEKFRLLAFKGIKSGRKKLSSKQIIGVIRWEYSISTHDDHSKFKIDDRYTAWYARKFERDYPHYMGIFEKRRIRTI